MTHQNLETVYEALALGIDAVGPEHAQLYLAKIALALAQALDDAPAALAVIEDCKADLSR
ncbi:hypothetical protein [Thalassovita sp.]|uniref:hypothetical protein n=1 Tax=Thalassovita sp. TaxID=1979401 RepID=UPI0028825979|nr:hypothetical protein [Thalassovita sp.]MDF1803419.1 hypothetical protein [Thalassovita sp.]